MPKRVVRGELVVVKLADLYEVDGPNPNVMTVEQEAELKESIRRRGFRQALTVVPRDGGGYWLSDGVHRKKVLLELGYVEAPALVKDGTEEDVRAERLALNRSRGQLDLTLAAADLKLLSDGGYDVAGCGLTDAEVRVLLKATELPTEDSVLDDGLEAGAAGQTPQAEAAKRYTLTLTYDSKLERDTVRERLLARGLSMEEGLRAFFSAAESPEAV